MVIMRKRKRYMPIGRKEVRKEKEECEKEREMLGEKVEKREREKREDEKRENQIDR